MIESQFWRDSHCRPEIRPQFVRPAAAERENGGHVATERPEDRALVDVGSLDSGGAPTHVFPQVAVWVAFDGLEDFVRAGLVFGEVRVVVQQPAVERGRQPEEAESLGHIFAVLELSRAQRLEETSVESVLVLDVQIVERALRPDWSVGIHAVAERALFGVIVSGFGFERVQSVLPSEGS